MVKGNRYAKLFSILANRAINKTGNLMVSRILCLLGALAFQSTLAILASLFY